MGDDRSRRAEKSLFDIFKEEWSLFFESFIEDDEVKLQSQNLSLGTNELLDRMSFEEIEDLKRNLSAERKSINQQLEILQKEVDRLNETYEQARFQSEDTSRIQNEMNVLSDKGHKLSHKLNRLNERLKLVYRHEKEQFEL